MKKIIVFLVLALTSPFATSGAVGGVVTVTQFGPYINCVVNNNTQYNIVVKQTAYNVTGSQGNAHSVFDCTSNCVVPAHTTNVFSGPNNHPGITAAKCDVIL